MQLKVCEIKYQKWYYLPTTSNAVHSHAALWCHHQQNHIIGLYLPGPIQNIISFSNNALVRARKLFKREQPTQHACITTSVINCDRKALPRWCLCGWVLYFWGLQLIILLFLFLLKLHFRTWVLGFTSINRTGRCYWIKMFLFQGKAPVISPVLLRHHNLCNAQIWQAHAHE